MPGWGRLQTSLTLSESPSDDGKSKIELSESSLTYPLGPTDNDAMSANSPKVQVAPFDDATCSAADDAALLEGLVSGKSLDPEVLNRIRVRAEEITAEIRRERGLLDDDTFQSLLDDDA